MTKSTGPEEQKTERFNMFMSPSEMEAIDAWAWKNRIRSKSEAVRRLCYIALQTEPLIDKLGDAALAYIKKSNERDTDVEFGTAGGEQWLLSNIGDMLDLSLRAGLLGDLLNGMREGSSFEDAMKTAQHRLSQYQPLIEAAQKIKEVRK
ncbi:hypothetical protein [Gellertiella hungarica]|uniref:Uncharacterized protein n=1 Tax=Gellertiella hungarica TaxID=1572859 RepID=A0A7W6NKP5_9HYPH|nr:hypothetical protein [Gellertiella hungarica]MBB4064749.1 hypothetical protein [Gellertiella hungarica]